MTNEEKVTALNSVINEWTGVCDDGIIVPLTLHALTSLYNQSNQLNLLSGKEVIELLGEKEDYSI